MIRVFSKTLFRANLYTPLTRMSFNSQQEKSQMEKTTQELKASQTVARCQGMNQFLTRIYNTTGLSIMTALGTSYAVMSIPALTPIMGGLSMFGILGMLVGIIGASYMKPIDDSVVVNGVPVYRTKNTPLRLGLYALGTMSLGLTAAPLFAYATAISPSILPTAIGMTTAIFGGSSLVAYNMPKDKMLGYGGALGGALLGLIGLQIVGILSSLIMGPNALSMMLFRADNYLGIALFSVFIAYDTHVAIRMYQERQADHLGMSIQFLMNFWNILVRIVSILSRRD